MNFASVGGRQESGEWNFGWIAPQSRTALQAQRHDESLEAMTPFNISGATDESDEKVDLTDIWSDARVIAALGFAFPGIHQYTGSCVGAGGGTAVQTLQFLESIRLGEPEQVKVIFWLLAYGRSRLYLGDRGPGEGSTGSTYARAAREDGYVPNDLAGLPPFENKDMLSWYAKAEMSWSDGDAEQTMNLLPKSRKHLVKSTADITTTDQLEQAIRNLYPCTNASSLIPNPRVEADGEAYGRVARSGGHQTTFLGVWRHPTKGKRFFKYQNQWGLGWGKNSACWIPDEDAQAIINNGRETYAFSQFEGFPSQTFKWSA